MEKEISIETRGYLNHLIDYTTVFGDKKTMEDAVEIIKDLPSIPILLTIASINLQLYLNDSGLQGQKMQNTIIKALLGNNSAFVEKILTAYSNTVDNKQWPTIFYRYSNLLIYELVFRNYNKLPVRELSQLEIEKLMKAYLIINSIVNERVKINDGDFENFLEKDEVERFVLPQFIYQKDFTSNVDYTNQVTRCFYFFQYLEAV